MKCNKYAVNYLKHDSLLKTKLEDRVEGKR
jgi:hypothetical protein